MYVSVAPLARERRPLARVSVRVAARGGRERPDWICRCISAVEGLAEEGGGGALTVEFVIGAVGWVCSRIWGWERRQCVVKAWRWMRGWMEWIVRDVGAL